jgi:UDP-N-acetylglucosamine diphosphorylase/glucosamine-1-phosphate N-acetyltransferase
MTDKNASAHKPDRMAVVILAAGKGTRMRSDLPKVLHLLDGKPLVEHVVETAEKLSPEKIVVVVGYKAEMVKTALKSTPLNSGLEAGAKARAKNISFVEQKEQLGTAHAVLCSKSELEKFDGVVIVLSGDVPLIDKETILELIRLRNKTASPVALLTADAPDPAGYGRIIRGNGGEIAAIVEEGDATQEQKAICEINAGVYVFDAAFLFNAIWRITPDNTQKEFYLTDVVRIALASGEKVSALKTANIDRVRGVNRPEELEALNNRAAKAKK